MKTKLIAAIILLSGCGPQIYKGETRVQALSLAPDVTKCASEGSKQEFYAIQISPGRAENASDDCAPYLLEGDGSISKSKCGTTGFFKNVQGTASLTIFLVQNDGICLTTREGSLLLEKDQ